MPINLLPTQTKPLKLHDATEKDARYIGILGKWNNFSPILKLGKF